MLDSGEKFEIRNAEGEKKLRISDFGLRIEKDTRYKIQDTG
jgi:hypothetical protein